MKKIMFMIAAVAAFCFTSCSNEDVLEQTTKKDLKINVTVADIAGDAATRAVKKGWVAGDKINIWFDGHWAQTPDLVISYNGEAWVSGKIADAVVEQLVDGDTGTMFFLYEGHNDLSVYSWYNSYSYLVPPRYELPNTKGDISNTHAVAAPLMATSYTGESQYYTYNKQEGTLNLTLNNWTLTNTVQFVVTGLSGNSDDWALMVTNDLNTIHGINRYGRTNFTIVDLGMSSIYPGVSYTVGVPNADGTSFHFVRASGQYVTETFTLLNLQNGAKYTFTPDGTMKITDGISNNKVYSAKLAFSNFTEAQ